jgi:hypothetical protein
MTVPVLRDFAGAFDHPDVVEAITEGRYGDLVKRGFSPKIGPVSRMIEELLRTVMVTGDWVEGDADWDEAAVQMVSAGSYLFGVPPGGSQLSITAGTLVDWYENEDLPEGDGLEAFADGARKLAYRREGGQK